MIPNNTTIEDDFSGRVEVKLRNERTSRSTLPLKQSLLKNRALADVGNERKVKAFTSKKSVIRLYLHNFL